MMTFSERPYTALLPIGPENCFSDPHLHVAYEIRQTTTKKMLVHIVPTSSFSPDAKNATFNAE